MKYLFMLCLLFAAIPVSAHHKASLSHRVVQLERANRQFRRDIKDLSIAMLCVLQIQRQQEQEIQDLQPFINPDTEPELQYGQYLPERSTDLKIEAPHGYERSYYMDGTVVWRLIPNWSSDDRIYSKPTNNKDLVIDDVRDARRVNDLEERVNILEEKK